MYILAGKGQGKYVGCLAFLMECKLMMTTNMRTFNMITNKASTTNDFSDSEESKDLGSFDKIFGRIS